MRTVCMGWVRTHPAPITLDDDGVPDARVHYGGMCRDCCETYGCQRAAGAVTRFMGVSRTTSVSRAPEDRAR